MPFVNSGAIIPFKKVNSIITSDKQFQVNSGGKSFLFNTSTHGHQINQYKKWLTKSEEEFLDGNQEKELQDKN